MRTVEQTDRLRKLRDVLMGGEIGHMWPAGHVWDYTHYCGCARGVANELWPQAKLAKPRGDHDIEVDGEKFRAFFGLSVADDNRIFMNAEYGNQGRNTKDRIPVMDVSPWRVADIITDILEASDG